MQRSIIILIILYFFIPPIAIAQHQHLTEHNDKPAILLPGMVQHQHPIATKNDDAQQFFNQGLVMLFGFNRPEAERSFRRAIELDSTAPMAYWGLALALGRHLNMDNDMDVQLTEANKAIQTAVTLSSSAPSVERAYIMALAKRSSDTENPNGQTLDSLYCNAMRELVKQYPDDVDAATLYAEALMTIHRYQWFDAMGNPINETEKIKAILEAILRRNPDHLLANHLYIHLLDTSPYPEYALGSAYRLSDLASGPGMGNLIHMPSHIFMTLGEYGKTVSGNKQAVLADEQYLNLTGIKWNVYTLGYYPHNLHMMVRALMERGNHREAKQVAGKLAAYIEPAFDQMPMMIDFYFPNVYFVLVRFLRWDEVLMTPKPAIEMFMTTALWHYARTLAFAAKGRRDEAMAEQAAFNEARQRVPIDWMWMFNKQEKILGLASIILTARLAPDEQTAIKHWRKAVVQQDNLNYDEPPAWYYPVRESLGGSLLRTGQAAEAEAVFRDNLKRYPRNGRTLFGLLESLKAQMKTAEAEWVKKEIENVWDNSAPPLQIADF
jgi:tetratricopeptide (TPR) repeat protein